MIRVLVAASIALLLASGEPEHDPVAQAYDMNAREATERASEVSGVLPPVCESQASPEAFEVPLSASYVAYVIKVCGEYSLDPAILFGMMEQESGYNPDAVGDGGRAIGILQVQPGWHYDRMARLGVTDLSDEWQEIWVACDYLSELLGIYGSYEKALTAYRYGDLNVTGEDYASIVMENAERIRK